MWHLQDTWCYCVYLSHNSATIIHNQHWPSHQLPIRPDYNICVEWSYWATSKILVIEENIIKEIENVFLTFFFAMAILLDKVNMYCLAFKVWDFLSWYWKSPHLFLAMTADQEAMMLLRQYVSTYPPPPPHHPTTTYCVTNSPKYYDSKLTNRLSFSPRTHVHCTQKILGATGNLCENSQKLTGFDC